jgi:hypothetical protein
MLIIVVLQAPQVSPSEPHGSPEFVPPLPTWKKAAISSVGAGLLNKVILRFPTAFWRKGGSDADGDVSMGQAARPSKAGAAAPAKQAALARAQAQAQAQAEPIPSEATADPNTADLLASFGWGAAPAPAPAAPPALALTSSTYNNAEANDKRWSVVTAKNWASMFGVRRLRCMPLPRVVSFVPCMDLLSARFHLQPAHYTDAQLMAAAALALHASHDIPPSAELVDATAARVLDRTDVFKALTAVYRARGDIGHAAALLNQWLGPPDAIDVYVDTPPSPAELEADVPADLAAVYQTTSDYAASVFQLPVVSPPPHYELQPADDDVEMGGTDSLDAAATTETGLIAHDALSAPSNVHPAAPGPASAAAAAASARGPVDEDTALERGLAALPPVPDALSATMLGPTDDSFGRAVVGDAPWVARRRGEAYMCWAMDRPSAGAGIGATAALKLRAGVLPASVVGKAMVKAVAMDDSPELSQSTDGDGAPVLIVMMAGDAADWVEGTDDATVTSTVLGALRTIFPAEDVPEPVAAHVTRWRSDPFARCSYSYLPPHSHGTHYDLLAAPVAGRLLWAGEATSRHHPTTVAGAFDSGVREAVRLGRLFSRARDPDVVSILAARQQRLHGIGQGSLHTPTPTAPAPASSGPTMAPAPASTAAIGVKPPG